MNTPIRILAAGAIAALLCACGESQPTASLSDMLRRSTTSQDQVQFVSYVNPPGLAEFDYSKGDAPIRTWRFKRATGPYHACTSGSQTFWILFRGAGQIIEYSASSVKPLKTIAVTGMDCAIDSSTGDLAVPDSSGNVTIFTNGSGSGQVISDGFTHSWSATYDAAGNLFVVGDSGSDEAFAELPKGATQFEMLPLSNKVFTLNGGFLRWDGTYLALFYEQKGVIYRYRAEGKVAQLVGTVKGVSNEIVSGSFWNQAGLLFCTAIQQTVLVYDYPSGTHVASLGPLKGAEGGVVSLTP